MKSSVIKEMTTDELKERLEEEQKQLNKLKMNHTVSPLDNPMVITQSRKVIAKIKTELRTRELETK